MPIKINRINLEENLFFFVLKINFIPPFFFEILRRYYTHLLFWVLWAYLAMTSKNDILSL